MPGRAPSPVPSENEFDIADALLGDDSDADGNHEGRNAGAAKQPHNASELGLGGDSSDEEFISLAQTASNRKASNIKGRSVKKGGGFQAMGLNANLLKAITRKGFSVPTPIQRKTVPLVLDGQDVVGMARTGSGKTAAFVVPMIEKLKAHSAQVGARALILSPSRELALQTLKVVKELGRGTDLKATLLVGGDSLEEQFGFVASNPDILIATPGRFLHLKVEMGLDLSSIKYVVFDEADRLFEMGFALQLSEILHALPNHRQTLLFSATLPKSLVEFARAGLHEPSLVRLDTESKISPDLQSAFFSLQTADKEGALLHIIQDVIQIPPGPTEKALELKRNGPMMGKKRKRSGTDGVSSTESPSPHSTIVFTATKHHVEYIANLLRLSGYAVSYVYGALDQTARKIQVSEFRAGLTNIMVVTDVAARGIDIPILANVINYDFPAQSKIFVHRVGRTARAGKQGWSYSLVRDSDLPYMLDLQLFLAKRLCVGRSVENPNYALDIVAGGLARDKIERCGELSNKLLDYDVDLAALRTVAAKGEKLYNRTRHSASTQSVKRAKQIVSSTSWTELHPLFNDASDNAEAEREKMLARISGFRPQETVFEIGRQGQLSNAGEVIRKQRQHIQAKKERAREAAAVEAQDESPSGEAASDVDIGEDNDADELDGVDADMASASEDELEITFSQDIKSKGRGKRQPRDESVYMSYTPSGQNMAEERAYGVHTGGASAHSAANFLTEARSVALDMTNDEGTKGFAEPSRRATGQRWDKKSKKYVSRANDEDGSRADSKGGAKIRSESGGKIAASFRSGRFDAWRRSNKVSALPRVGEDESKSNLASRFAPDGAVGNRRWRHNTEKAPKPADPKRDDYYSRKKRVEVAKEKRVGRFKFGEGKEEVRPLHKVRQQRMEKEKRKSKNARPSRKK